jgi:hypothetical protein
MPVNAGQAWKKRFWRQPSPLTSNQSTSLYNSFEGGTPGTAITVANSGGLSGNAFTTINGAAPNQLSYDTVQAAHGYRSALIHSYSGNQTVNWYISDGSSVVWFRLYVYPTQWFPAVATFLELYGGPTGSTFISRLQVSPTGAIAITNSSSLAIATAPAPILLNQWTRIEGYVYAPPVAVSTLGGMAELKIFNPMDSVTPLSTTTSAPAQVFNGNTVKEILFGDFNGVVYSPTWIDDVAVATQTGYIGPVIGQSSPINPGSRQHSNIIQPGKTWRRKHMARQQSVYSPNSVTNPAGGGGASYYDDFFLMYG